VPRLQDFAGAWRLTRRIADRAGGQCLRFAGTARFVADVGGLAYEERGVLRLPGQPPFEAHRRYLWREEGGLIVVDHGDGRAFHAFDPAAPEAEHLCPPDTYRVAYRFARWPLWSALWTVAGPRKDYRMLTRFTPRSGADRTGSA
jgi:hypothetical protein